MILNGSKKLVPKADLKTVDVGNHPEVSVKVLWLEYKDREEVSKYWPPKIAKGRQIQKEYFFNILNTFVGDELRAILDHANAQRNDVAQEGQKQEAIVLCEEMADLMFRFPWISVSHISYLLSLPCLFHFQRSKGNTVNLIKASAK